VGRKILLISVLVAIMAFGGLNIYISRTKQISLKIPQTSQIQYGPQVQTMIPPVEASQLTSVDSPDGKLTLTLKTVKNKNGITYTFSVSGREVFVKTVDLSTLISVPANTWSPNGKYVF